MRKKVTVLLPLAFNDGSLVPGEVRDSILEEMYVLCGGYTVAGTVKGAFRMPDGSKQVEDLLEVWLAVEEGDLPALRQLVAVAARTLAQECMYFEVSGSTVEFIPPPANPEQPASGNTPATESQ